MHWHREAEDQMELSGLNPRCASRLDGSRSLEPKHWFSTPLDQQARLGINQNSRHHGHSQTFNFLRLCCLGLTRKEGGYFEMPVTAYLMLYTRDSHYLWPSLLYSSTRRAILQAVALVSSIILTTQRQHELIAILVKPYCKHATYPTHPLSSQNRCFRLVCESVKALDSHLRPSFPWTS